MHRSFRTTPVIFCAGLIAAAGVAGCARVKPEQLDAEVAKLRQEMQAGDSSLAARQNATDQRVSTLETRLDSLQRDLDSLGAEFHASVQRLETAIRFNAPVHFDFDDATIREADRPLLDRFAATVQHHYGGALITIEGFADPAGNPAYNKRLGQARAEAVRDYLVTNGSLGSDRLRVVSYGESKDRLVVPNAQGPGDAGLETRRVAFVVDLSGAAPAGETASR